MAHNAPSLLVTLFYAVTTTANLQPAFPMAHLPEFQEDVGTTEGQTEGKEQHAWWTSDASLEVKQNKHEESKLFVGFMKSISWSMCDFFLMHPKGDSENGAPERG